MLVVGDVQDMFVPLVDGLLVDVSEAEAVIDSLLEQLPLLFSDTRETEVALGPAIQAGMEALKVGPAAAGNGRGRTGDCCLGLGSQTAVRFCVYIPEGQVICCMAEPFLIAFLNKASRGMRQQSTVLSPLPRADMGSPVGHLYSRSTTLRYCCRAFRRHSPDSRVPRCAGAWAVCIAV